MKKQLISILTAGCLMAAMVPAAFAADTNDLQTQIDNAQAGSTITLRENVTLSDPLIITKDIKIDGGKQYSITYTSQSSDPAISIKDDADVTFTGVTVNATDRNGRGVSLDSAGVNFTFEDSTMNVGNRGIQVNAAGLNSDGAISVIRSTIQNSQKPDDKTYENWSAIGDYRGMSLWNLNGATISIVDSDILGFGYSLNLAGDVVNGVRDANGAKISISQNSNIWGWTALNIWTCNTIFEITNSDLRGINVSNGSSNGFAAVVLNDNIYGNLETPLYNTLTFTGGSIGGYKYGTASEGLIRVGNQLSTRISFELYDDMDPVIFKSNVPNFNFIFTGNLTPEAIDYYLYQSGKITGTENTDTQFPAATYNAVPQISYEVIE